MEWELLKKILVLAIQTAWSTPKSLNQSKFKYIKKMKLF